MGVAGEVAASATEDVWIVSADDHLVEAPDIWKERLPSAHLDVAPRLERQKGLVDNTVGWAYRADDDGDWCDVWRYEDLTVPLWQATAAAGSSRDEFGFRPLLFEEIRSGCYEPGPRLEDMDVNHVEASLCFPNTFVRFAGQVFLEAEDKDLALLGVQAYNDWLTEFATATDGRVIPVGIVPLWDPDLAAAEVRRLADLGFHSVAFSELPANIGLPTLHGTHWDPFLLACQDTGIVIGIHVGSGSKFQTSSPDAPPGTASVLTFVNPVMSIIDWIYSGTLRRFPGVKICIAEAEIGHLPYLLQRMDHVWDMHYAWGWGDDRSGKEVLPDPPSTYFRRQIMCAFADDVHGVASIEEIGRANIAFEVDYPHSDGTWPHSLASAEAMFSGTDAHTRRRILRGNTIDFFGLDLPT